MITSCEFQFGFWDVTAREDATFGVSDNQPWAVIEDINLEEAIAFPDVATLEHNFGWPLDGTKELMPDDPATEAWGWWSTQLSQEDGSFSNPPTLTISFDNNHSSAGITLMFYATLPKLINIKWYGLNGVLLADKDFEPDDMTYFCDCQVEDYYEVVVTVKSMSMPRRFLRCIFILFGVLEVIGGRRITKAELTEEIDPIALTLPIQTILLSFFTAGGRFSLLDPSGAYKFFQWKQQLTGSATVDGVQRPMGVYYLQEASGRVDNLVDLTLVDSVGVLDTIDFMGGLYDKASLVGLLDEILEPENIEYELDATFTSETITGYLPRCTKRQALQQIAFAIGAVIDTTRSEIMHIYPTPFNVSHAIGPNRKVVGHKVALEELVTRVDITAHAYGLAFDERELSKSLMTAGRHTVHFSAPSLVTRVSGATLAVNHPNYAVVDVPADGGVIITGREYMDNATVYTVQAPLLPAGAKSSVKTIEGATLVDSARAPAVAQRVYEYYQRRYTDEGSALPGNDIERAGQVIEMQSLGSRSITGTISRLVVDLSGGHLARITMRGA